MVETKATYLKKHGNSFCLFFDKKVLTLAMNWAEGTPLREEYDATNKRIIITEAPPKDSKNKSTLS